MALTQEMISQFLTEQGGKARNSEMLNTFKDILNCTDPEEKKENRERFKRFVNNVAVVKEIDDVKYVVLKKKYQNLVSGNLASAARQSKVAFTSEGPNTFCSHGYDVEQRVQDKQEGKNLNSRLGDHNMLSHVSAPNDDVINNIKQTSSNIATQMIRTGNKDSVNLTEVWLAECIQEEPSKVKEHNLLGEPKTGKTGPLFAITGVKAQPERRSDEPYTSHVKQDAPHTVAACTETQKAAPKPCALPLRVPPPEIRVEAPPLDESSGKSVTEHDFERSPRTKRRQTEEGTVPSSPMMRRSYKTVKPGDEPRYPVSIPLDATEHEWLVRCAAGHWHQVHGLLLQDTHLASKRDFMSGFTALHWAAKCGNEEMVCKIMEIAKRGGTSVDVNARSHGGYTPLHIAAIHNQGAVARLLVHDYEAKVHVRDNSGRRAHHYLDKEVEPELRVLLGAAPLSNQETAHDRQDDDHLPDIHRGFNTLSRLFQPYGGHKKKYKPRLGYYSVSEEPEDENGLRRRPFSDVFL